MKPENFDMGTSAQDTTKTDTKINTSSGSSGGLPSKEFAGVEGNNAATVAAKRSSATTLAAGRRTRWNARQIAIMGLFAAMGVVLSFLKLPPFFPMVGFLTYDPANVPGVIGGIVFGPGVGTVIGLATHGLHALLGGDDGIYGFIMNFPAFLAFMLPVAILCHKSKSTPRLIIGLALGFVLSTAVMIGLNCLVTPHFMGVPLEALLKLLPFILAFNLVKAALNAVLSFAMYKSLQPVLEKQGS